MRVGECVLLMALAGLSACEPQNPAGLDLRPDPAEINARLAEMQLVRLADGSTIPVAPSSSTNLSGLVAAECFDRVKESTSGGDLNSCAAGTGEITPLPSDCQQQLCGSQLMLCAAALMMDVADTPVELNIGGVGIPPQRRATNAAIRERAAQYAREATLISGNALRAAHNATGAVGACVLSRMSDTVGFIEEPDMDYRAAFEGAFSQGIELSEQAVSDAMADNLAVAESLPAQFESGSVGRWAQWYGDTLSFTRAAQLEVPLQASGRALISDEAPCGSFGGDLDLVLPSDLVDLLRETGINPTILGDPTIDADALWTGAGLPEPGGMRDRLTETTGDPAFATMPLSTFYAVTGASDAELQLGRFRIADQAAATSPAPATTLVPSLGVGMSTTFSYYAATQRSQLARPEVQAASLAAGLASVSLHDAAVSEGSTGARPTMRYARNSQASFLDWAATVSSELVGLTAAARPDLVQIAGALSAVREGRLHIDYEVTLNGRLMGFELFGGYAPENLSVVTGDANAACQVDGSLEGEPCSPAVLPINSPSVASSPRETGFTERLTFSVVVPGVDDQTIYLLHRKEGATGNHPGDYRILQAIHVDWLSAVGAARDVVYPIVPASTFNAEQVVTNNVNSCDENEVSCAGILRNATIPLENSLSEDGSEYENSWQHYLRLARVTADRADRLGQEWIDTGFTADDRRERAWEKVEDACGDVGTLANGLDGMGSSGATCAVDSDCATASGERCVGGTCITTPNGLIEALGDEDPRARRLAECLGIGSDAIVPFATLGSEVVCLWRNRATGVVCEDVPGAPRCPYVRARGTEDDPADCTDVPAGTTLPDAGAYEIITVDATLGISRNQFGNSDTDGGDIIDTCNAIRRGWDNLSSSELESAIRGTVTLLGAQQIASRLGWVAEPFNLSHLTLDGVAWAPRGVVDGGGQPVAAGTGMIEHGVGTGDAVATSAAWPCGAHPEGIDCSSSALRQSLFCQEVACAPLPGEISPLPSNERRARINDRIARAVLALKITTAAPLGSFRSPFFADHAEAGYTVPALASADTLGDVHVGGRTETLRWYSQITQASGCSGVACDHDRDYYGDAYCMPNCVEATCPPIWSTLLANGTWDHRTNVNCNEPGSQAFAAFDPRRFQDVDPVEGWAGSRAPEITAAMWDGVVGAPAVSTGGGDRGDLLSREYVNNLYLSALLRDDLRSDDVVLSRDSGHIEDLTVWWHRNDENRAAIAGNWDHHGDSGPFARGLTVGNLNDALELMCEVQRSSAAACDPTAPPPMASAVRDLPAIRRHFECVAASVENAVDLAILSNVPREAVRGVGSNVGGTGFRIPQGTYGASIVRYGAAIRDLRASLPEVARILRDIGRDIERMQIVLRQMEIEEQRRILRVISRAVSEGGQCATAIGRAVSNQEQIVDAIAACANAAAQVAIGLADNDLAGESASEDLRARLVEINGRMDERMGTLNRISRQLREAVASLEVATVELESGRVGASRALAQATLSATTEGGRELRTNTVLRRRYNTARTRYWRAFSDAQRMSYLARIAIEQQVGMDLNSVQEDMTLVDRPDSWADRICTVTGIDYDRIRDFRDAEYQDYSDQFIGDYVTQLENFIESYRIDFPFQDGRDTAVISLRDDINEVRVPCALPAGNLLLASGALDAEVVGTDGDPLWQPAGCVDPTPGEISGCIARRRLSLQPNERPFADWQGGFDDVRAFEITFAPESESGTTLFTPDSSLVQVTAPVQAGRYRLSWYGRTPDLAGALEVRGASLTASAVSAEATTTGWTRYHYIFDVPRVQALTVHWVPLDPLATTAQSYSVAAPMLESLGDRVLGPSAAALDPALHPPTAYAESDEYGDHVVPGCEDATGVEFRRTEWQRRCQELCTEGFDRSCEAGVTYCYYETTFAIEPEAIASGRFLRGAGFPRGNYNYRIETIGVNFPGSASRICEGAGFPGTCYSNGSIPYSILHVGSHAVINHLGQADYLAPIFPGRLEDARGLATERYLTNPLSSADRSLMQDYMNRELRGRPLPGQYVVRVWDAPGVNFEGIEDVQIVLDYRYWTRQE